VAAHPASHPARRWESIGLAGLLLAFLVIMLPGLDAAPAAHDDEAWQASTGWKLATEGVFGSDMFAGFHGMDRHYYGYMPVHSFALAGMFRIAGPGLFQARLVSVLAGALTLVLIHLVARRLFGARVGLLAVTLSLFVRLTATNAYRLSGIPLLDVARIARYDIMVPVFGLAALLCYLAARDTGSSRLFALTGLLIGLSGLSHLYGNFWLIAIGLLAVRDRARWSDIAWAALGFAAPWAAYCGWVLANLPDWVGQTRNYGERFGLLDARWYLDNLRLEYLRWAPGLREGWFRPGVVLMLAALPPALVALARRSLRSRDRQARALLVPALVMPALFAFLIQLKQTNYIITIVPLFCMALAWAMVSAWDRSARARHRLALRCALALALMAVCAEGLARASVFARQAAHATPWPEFIDRVRAQIPGGARVLGLHRYWLGLEDVDFRSWATVFLRSSPATTTRPEPVETVLDDIAPDLILIDERMLDYFAGTGVENARPAVLRAWMEARRFTRAEVLQDRTYGRMEVWRIATPGG